MFGRTRDGQRKSPVVNTMYRTVWAVAMCLLAPNPASTAGSSVSELAELLEPVRARHDLPALAGAIVTRSGVEAAGVAGVRKYGASAKAGLTDQFHLGSCTKAMTATLAAMLVEERKLSWSTTLAAAFPELKGSLHPKLATVTLEQLLAHRAGLSDGSWPNGMSFSDVHNLKGTPAEQRWEYAKRVLAEEPVAEPGAKYIYTNRGYVIAGVMIERAAGASYEDLLTKRIFVPLKMETAGFGAMGSPGRIDQPWQHLLRPGEHVPIEPGGRSDNPVALAPAGTVHASIGDWARFIQMHLGAGIISASPDGRARRLLKQSTMNRLHQALPGGDYGFGWVTTERPWGGGRVLTHSGSNNQNFAVVWMAPLRGFAVLVATNQGGKEAEEACDEMASLLIQRHLGASGD